MQSINGLHLYNYIISGAQNVICNEHSLNAINVFPVADGDTGTNLALTMRTIISQAEKNEKAAITLDSISKIALSNAYGNSGVIFAQYFYGLSVEANNKETLTTEEFVHISNKAAQYAYEAVSAPKEGTILTAMREWGDELNNHKNNEFENVIDYSISKVEEIVKQSKNKLKVLRENNVVDAGAKAFLIFIKGINKFIKTGKLTFEKADKLSFANNHQNKIKGEVVQHNKYCTQFLVETDKSQSMLKTILKEYGDSLVVTKANHYVQVHLHTDTPEKVMEILLQEKNVLSQKVDNMAYQSGVVNNRKYKVGILTDSIADLSADIMEKEQINMIPMNVICDSIQYLDKVTITPSTFYENLDKYKMNPTSAQASKEVIEKQISFMAAHYESIICICVSSKMSGTYDNFKAVAEKLSKQGTKITVIDSQLNSAAEGLLVWKATELLKQGLNHDAIVEKLNLLKEKCHIYVSVKTLEYMIKGGRVSKVKGAILSRIKLKPIVSIDDQGNGSIYKPTLTQKGAVKQIVKKFTRDYIKNGIDEYCLVYSEDITQIDSIKKQLLKITGKQALYISQISPVVGLNAGRGAFAVGYIKGEKN